MRRVQWWAASLVVALTGCSGDQRIQAGGFTWTVPASFHAILPASPKVKLELQQAEIPYWRRWAKVTIADDPLAEGGWSVESAQKWQQNTLGFHHAITHWAVEGREVDSPKYRSICVQSDTTGFRSYAWLRCVTIGTTLSFSFSGPSADIGTASAMLNTLE